jgi:alpha-L-fucosidase 2
MLLQTCKGNVFLLPALPEEWPDGRIKGLKTEGNLSVDIEWKNRKVTKYRIVSPVTQKINVHVNGETKEASTHLS